MAQQQPPRPFLNCRFVIALAVIGVGFAVIYPFSPAARQQRRMHTMEVFWRQLREEVKDDPRFSKMKGGVSTSVRLFITFDAPIDADTWNKLIKLIEAKRDAFEHVSPITVLSFDPLKPGRSRTFSSK